MMLRFSVFLDVDLSLVLVDVGIRFTSYDISERKTEATEKKDSTRLLCQCKKRMTWHLQSRRVPATARGRG